jgi:hypothetical protein
LFLEQITEAGVIKPLFEHFDVCLRESGFFAQKGQIIDASFVEAPAKGIAGKITNGSNNVKFLKIGIQQKSARKILMPNGQRRTVKTIMGIKTIYAWISSTSLYGIMMSRMRRCMIAMCLAI